MRYDMVNSVRWVTVPLTSVNSLSISMKVSIILILLAQILKMCDVSDGCGFSSVRLRMSDLETAISGTLCEQGVPPSFVKLCADGLKSPFHPNGGISSYFQDR
jgi:hypothetical protein